MSALREQLQRVLEEKSALEAECQKNQVGKREKGKKGKKGRLQVQGQSRHTQTMSGGSHQLTSPSQPVTTSTTTPHPSPTTTPTTAHTTPSPTITTHSSPSTTHMSTSTHSATRKTTEPATDSTVDEKKNNVSMDTALTQETIATGNTPVPSVVETVAVDTVTKATTVETRKGTLEMVKDVISKVLVNPSDFVDADSATLHRIHGDLQQVCDVIRSCLVYSSLPEGAEGTGDANVDMENLASSQYHKLPPQQNRLVSNRQLTTVRQIIGGSYMYV